VDEGPVLRRKLRHFVPLIALFIAAAEAQARDLHFNAGLATFTAGRDPEFEVLVWYPSDDPEAPVLRILHDAYLLSAALDAPPATGRFPTVLVSHESFGNPLDHRELAASLARHGFVVIAPVHVGDAVGEPHSHDTDLVFVGRAWQAVLALDAALIDPRLGKVIDNRRIGMLGFGTGGYTGLLVAGGKPDFARWPLYCDKHMSDFALCGGSAFPAIRITRPGWRPPHDARLKALLLLAPLGLPFGSGALDEVNVPVRLYEAEHDTMLLREPNAAAILAVLPHPPEHAVIEGGHFVFVDPCPPALARTLRATCGDAAGIDRVAIHERLESEIRDFFERVL
jgi:predicted dienelactone hydrolase